MSTINRVNTIYGKMCIKYVLHLRYFSKNTPNKKIEKLKKIDKIIVLVLQIETQTNR